MRRRLTLPAAKLMGSCSIWSGAGPGCELAEGPYALPEALKESSGVAASLRTPGVFWTHSDNGGPAQLWAVDGRGAVLGRIELADLRVRDAEDLATAPCPEGSCLYLADIGDNYAERDTLVVLRAVEPDPDARTIPAQRLPVQLPDAPRDAEAIFVLPEERIFVVTKGGDWPVTVYRYPLPLRPDTLVVLEEVQRLSETPRVLPRQVTGAGASRDGTLVVIRTYETLLLHRWDGTRLIPIVDETVNLRSVRESQGEGVGIGDDGIVVLTSEGGPAGGAGSIAVLRCVLGEVG